jgi:TP901 family phage tail tape measure protein
MGNDLTNNVTMDVGSLSDLADQFKNIKTQVDTVEKSVGKLGGALSKAGTNVNVAGLNQIKTFFSEFLGIINESPQATAKLNTFMLRLERLTSLLSSSSQGNKHIISKAVFDDLDKLLAKIGNVTRDIGKLNQTKVIPQIDKVASGEIRRISRPAPKDEWGDRYPAFREDIKGPRKAGALSNSADTARKLQQQRDPKTGRFMSIAASQEFINQATIAQQGSSPNQYLVDQLKRKSEIREQVASVHEIPVGDAGQITSGRLGNKYDLWAQSETLKLQKRHQQSAIKEYYQQTGIYPTGTPQYKQQRTDAEKYFRQQEQEYQKQMNVKGIVANRERMADEGISKEQDRIAMDKRAADRKTMQGRERQAQQQMTLQNQYDTAERQAQKQTLTERNRTEMDKRAADRKTAQQRERQAQAQLTQEERYATDQRAQQRVDLRARERGEAGTTRTRQSLMQRNAQSEAAARIQMQRLQSPIERQLQVASLRTMAYGAIGGALYGAVSSWSNIRGVLEDVEQKLVSLRKVLDPVKTDFEAMKQSMFDMAKQTGRTFGEAGDVMGAFARQGRPAGDVVKLSQAALTMGNIGEMDPKDAVGVLTSVLAQFNLKAEDATMVLDKLNNVSNKNAVSFQNLALAVKGIGASFTTQGGTFDEALAVITALSKATQITGPMMERTYRRIFANINNPRFKAILETAGVQTTNETGGIRSPFAIMGDLSKKWPTMGSQQQEEISRSIGGGIYKSYFVATINNWDAATKAFQDSLHAQGSAYKEQTEYLKTYTAKLNATKTAWTETAQAIGEAGLLDWFKGVLFFSRSVAESDITKGLGKFALTSSPVRNTLLGTVGIAALATEIVTALEVPANRIARLTGSNQLGLDVSRQGHLLQLQNLLSTSNLEAGRGRQGVSQVLQPGVLAAQAALWVKGNPYLVAGAVAIAAVAAGFIAFNKHISDVQTDWVNAGTALKSFPFVVNDLVGSLQELSNASGGSAKTLKDKEINVTRAYKNLLDNMTNISKVQRSLGIFSQGLSEQRIADMMSRSGIRWGKEGLEVDTGNGFMGLKQFEQLPATERERIIKQIQGNLGTVGSIFRGEQANLAYQRMYPGQLGAFGMSGTLMPGGRVVPPGWTTGKAMTPEQRKTEEGFAYGEINAKQLSAQYDIIKKQMEETNGDSLRTYDAILQKLEGWKSVHKRPEDDLIYGNIRSDAEGRRSIYLNENLKLAEEAARAGADENQVVQALSEGYADVADQIHNIFRDPGVQADRTLNIIYADMEMIADEEKRIQESIAYQNALYEQRRTILTHMVNLYGQALQITRDMTGANIAQHIRDTQGSIIAQAKNDADMRAQQESIVGVGGSIGTPGEGSGLAILRAKEAVALEEKNAAFDEGSGKSNSEKEAARVKYNDAAKATSDLEAEYKKTQDDIIKGDTQRVKDADDLMKSHLELVDALQLELEYSLGIVGASENLKAVLGSVATDYHRIAMEATGLYAAQNKSKLTSGVFSGMSMGGQFSGKQDELYLDMVKQGASFFEKQYDYYSQKYQEAAVARNELMMTRGRGQGAQGSLYEGAVDDWQKQWDEAYAAISNTMDYYGQKITESAKDFVNTMADATIAEMVVAARREDDEIQKTILGQRIGRFAEEQTSGLLQGFRGNVGIGAGGRGRQTTTDIGLASISGYLDDYTKANQDTIKAYYDVTKKIQDSMQINTNAGRNPYTGTQSLMEELDRLNRTYGQIYENLQRLVAQQEMLKSAKAMEEILLNVFTDINAMKLRSFGYKNIEKLLIESPGVARDRFPGAGSMIYEGISKATQSALEGYMNAEEEIARLQDQINKTSLQDVDVRKAQLALLDAEVQKASELYDVLSKAFAAENFAFAQKAMLDILTNAGIAVDKFAIQYRGISGASRDIQRAMGGAGVGRMSSLYIGPEENKIQELSNFIKTLEEALINIGKAGEEWKDAARIAFDLKLITAEQYKEMLAGTATGSTRDFLVKTLSDAMVSASGLFIDKQIGESKTGIAKSFGDMLIEGNVGGIGSMSKVSGYYRDASKDVARKIFEEGSPELKNGLINLLRGTSLSSLRANLKPEDFQRLSQFDEMRNKGKFSYDIERFTEAAINAPSNLKNRMPSPLEIMQASGAFVNISGEKPIDRLNDTMALLNDTTGELIDVLRGPGQMSLAAGQFALPGSITPDLTNINPELAMAWLPPEFSGVPSTKLTAPGLPDINQNIFDLTNAITVNFPDLTKAMNNLASRMPTVPNNKVTDVNGYSSPVPPGAIRTGQGPGEMPGGAGGGPGAMPTVPTGTPTNWGNPVKAVRGSGSSGGGW